VESASAIGAGLEMEVSSLPVHLADVKEGASNAGNVVAEVPSVLSKKPNFTLVWDLDETLCTIVHSVEGESLELFTYLISYLDTEECIMIRPHAVEVLKKVSTKISNWSNVFMF
jgi:hypothetical protein